MPPSFKITRAVVEDSFREALISFWKKRWTELNKAIVETDVRAKQIAIRDNAPTLSRLKGICTNPKLFDQELAKLHLLPYEKFVTKEYQGRVWMMGLTRPVILTDGLKRWQGPRYWICIPDDVDRRESKYAFHFLPQGFENLKFRHPHHKENDTDIWDNDHPLPGNPLGHTSWTCWGSFGTIVQTCVQSGDLVDLYRTLSIYISRVDMGSLLVPWRTQDKIFKQIEDAEVPDKVLQPLAYARWELEQKKVAGKRK
jgi:hypothetical protein